MSNKWFKKTEKVESEEEEFENDSFDEISDEEEEEDDDFGSDEESDDEKPKTAAKPATTAAAPVANKWFKKPAGAAKEESDEDEDEDEYEDDEDESDEDEAPKAAAKKQPEAVSKRSRLVLDDEDDEDDQKRVVRSHKAKNLEELQQLISTLFDQRKRNAWKEIQDSFLALNKSLEKLLKQQKDVPKVYIKCVVALEEACQKAAKDKILKSKISTVDMKAVGPMLSRIRKNNTQYKELIEEYQKNPELFYDEDEESGEEEAEEEEAADSEEEQEEKPAPAARSKWFKKAADSDEEDEDEEEEDEEEDEESDDDKPRRKPAAAATTAAQPRANIWLKQADAGKEKTAVADQAKKKTKGAVRGPAEPKKVVKDKVAPQQPKQKKLEEIEWTDDLIDEYIAKVKANKGKRGVDPQEQYDLLKLLFQKSKRAEKQIEILLIMVSVSFDIGSATSNFMPVQVWNNNYLNFLRILQIIDRFVETNGSVTLVEEEEAAVVTAGSSSAPAAAATQDAAPGTLRISGNLVTVFERLDDEFTKSLQYIDPHTHNYVKRLNDENMALDLAERLFQLYRDVVAKPQLDKATRIALRLFNRLHFRKQSEHEQLLSRQREQIAKVLQEGAFNFSERLTPAVVTNDLAKVLKTFSGLVYKHSFSEVDKTRVLLMLIFHYAVMGKFYEARDMLLMSRIQDTIHRLDVTLQISYNRALAQVGLCAFRSGMIHDAHQCLVELCSSGKTRDLLAQGLLSTRHQQTALDLKQRQEFERVVPYHMHINISKLEAVHLISAMLLEIPNMAQTNATTLRSASAKRKRVISKTLRKKLDSYDRQFFLGPPESTSEHIYFASKALLRGDWSECFTVLQQLNVWNLVTEGGSKEINDMLLDKIKVEALRTYLLQFSKHYDNIGQQFLAQMFGLSENRVHSIVSKMIINDEQFAAWDQPTQTIVVDRTSEPSRLQQLALQLAERANALVEQNEKMLDIKTGGTGLLDGSQEESTSYSSYYGGASRGESREGGAQRQRQQGGEQQQQRSSSSGDQTRKPRLATGPIRSDGSNGDQRGPRGPSNRGGGSGGRGGSRGGSSSGNRPPRSQSQQQQDSVR